MNKREFLELLEKSVGESQRDSELINRAIDSYFFMDESWLDLSNIEIRELPPEIGRLKKLEGLILNNTKLKYLPQEINQLTSLKTLDLSNTNIGDLPREIGQLPKLSVLYLNNIPIQSIPNEFFDLELLAELFLNGSHLNEVPPEISKLTNLVWLDLRNNNLNQLPQEIGHLPHLIRLDVAGNPLTSPPFEIVSRGINAIRKYFNSLEGESKILNEVKILLVGEGSAGKTSLVRRLLGESFNKNEPSTHGILIRDWNVGRDPRKIKVNIWDFGGQEIMHATHQFFLSKRSLYILVLDGRRDERPEYWLQHIESFGGDSPILIVLNKCDANPGFEINHPFLCSKYPSIKGVFRTSCSTNQGIREFKTHLINELCELKLIETRWANSWFIVKENLENLHKDFISYDQFESICKDANITEIESQDVLVDFLNDLGVIVHFKEFELEDTHILDPKWVTTAVYKIINSEIAATNHGILNLRNLNEILCQEDQEDYHYPRSKHKYIIGLMKKFELCYSLDDETILIPQLIEIVEPEFEFDYSSSLKFMLRYDDFLPLSIMPRFIVKRHQDIKNNLCWRTGVILQNDDFESTAVIRADIEANRIYIYVNGRQKKDYLAVILLFFRELNDSFQKLKVSERVPMPDNPEISASYKTLINHASKGLNEFIPDGSDKIYRVSELLGLVQLDEYGKDGQEIFNILKRIEGKINDKRSFVESANRIVDLKPNIFGIGFNVNELIDKLYEAYENKNIRKKK